MALMVRRSLAITIPTVILRAHGSRFRDRAVTGAMQGRAGHTASDRALFTKGVR